MGTIIALLAAYLIGSLSASILLCKFLKFPDPRTQGSGNAGATNVLRTLGKDKAIMVLLGDGIKGFLAVLLGVALGAHGAMLGLVALLAVIGHIFPVFFKFKGGKGVATAMGTLLMLSPFAGLLAIATWVVVAVITRYASLASMVSMIAAVIFLLIFSQGAYVFPVVIIAAAIIWKHLENINRLRNGTESKIKFKSDKEAKKDEEKEEEKEEKEKEEE